MTSIFGVEPERKEHPAIKSGKKELGDAPGHPLNAFKVDGQRLFKGPGSGGMGGTLRKKGDTGGATRAPVGSFRIRKRALKG